jgi:hypothetical protein
VELLLQDAYNRKSVYLPPGIKKKKVKKYG